MKHKVLAGLVVAGVLGISGAAFAGAVPTVKAAVPPRVVVQERSHTVAQRPQPPKFEQGQRPPMPPEMSRDHRRMPPPRSFDRRPPDGKRPPMSRDNRMPPPPGAHSRDKRPPEFRK